jgi:hypothetical protein
MNTPVKRPVPAETRHVALIVETSAVYGRQILRGIARYLRTHPEYFNVFVKRETGFTPGELRSRLHLS